MESAIIFLRSLYELVAKKAVEYHPLNYQELKQDDFKNKYKNRCPKCKTVLIDWLGKAY